MRRQQREFDPGDIPPVAVAPQDEGIREARRRLADRVAARRQKEQALELPRDDFVRRLDDARAAVAPREPVAYRFTPLSGAFVIKAITNDDLAIAVPGTTLKWPSV